MARPTKFSDQLRSKMIALYEKGATDAEVAKEIGVSRTTLFNWRVKDAELLDTIKSSKSIADDLVESALFSRATGYKHPEEKIFVYEGHPIRVPTTKHYPPDVTAGIFWLCNRQPDRWKRGMFVGNPDDHSPGQSEKKEKRSFPEFCLVAGYPEPFEQQVGMMTFSICVDDPRLLLGARGYGKTDYVTILGVAYDIYLHGAETSNLIISKSKTRNASIMQEIAQALKANGVQLEKENSTCIRIAGMKGKDHSVEALTIKSSFRGRHPKRIIMDDPVTEEDTSEAMRALVKKKYDEAYKLCKNIVIIGQPAHAFDLYAELRPQLKKLEVPHGTIPQLDADLEAMKLAGVDPASIMMSYHLKIPKEGQSVFANLKFIENFPDGDSVAFIDPSDGGDFTSMSALRGFMDGVAAEGHAFKKAWYHCLDEIVPILVRLKVRRLAFETNCTGNQPIEQLRKLLAPYGIGVVGIHSDTNKESVILAAGSYSHLIHLSKNSNKAYTDQVVRYEASAKHDDGPDSLARGLQWLGLIKGKK